MYFAVQQMAAELSTGVLVMQHIEQSGSPLSMLVIETSSQFHKKATGLITFECKDGELAQKKIEKSIHENSAQQIEMEVKAFDESKTTVSDFKFIWSVKPKSR